MKGLSNIVAVLGLIVVAVISVSIGYTLMTQYLSRSLKPSPELDITYAKLIFITDSENVAGTLYVTFKGEIGLANPGPQTTIKVCVVSLSRGTGTLTLIASELLNYCSQSIVVPPGYTTYSFILRVPRSVMSSLGCTSYAICPRALDWHFSIYALNPSTNFMERVAVVKPVYVIP